jgi:hypothetical protein
MHSLYGALAGTTRNIRQIKDFTKRTIIKFGFHCAKFNEIGPEMKGHYTHNLLTWFGKTKHQIWTLHILGQMGCKFKMNKNEYSPVRRSTGWTARNTCACPEISVLPLRACQTFINSYGEVITVTLWTSSYADCFVLHCKTKKQDDKNYMT